jgi:hypothetical protein
MKNNKIILTVLILFMIVMIALIFSGCGGMENPVTPSPELEPGQIPAPNLSISTHEVEAGEQYRLIWDQQSLFTQYEIKESFKDKNGNITTKTILEFEDCDTIQTMLDHFEQLNESFVGTIFYVLEFYSDSWMLPIEKSIPGTYYYSIRSKSIIEEDEYASPWYVDPPESGDVYVKVLPDPDTANKDAEIHDIEVLTGDNPLQLNKWYSVEVTVENTGDVTQNFKISGFGSYSTDFKEEDIFLEIDLDDYGYARFQCKFTGTLIDSRQLHFTVYDEYANELDAYWEEFDFVSEPISAPTVTASQGTYENKVYISWDKVDRASFYKLYRSDLRGGIKTELTNWLTLITHFDYDITPGKHYYYYVRSATSNDGENASGFSDSAEGWAYVPQPDTTLPAPTGVDASDGGLTDQVYITWNSVSGASHYKVYKATSETGNKTAITSWKSSLYYPDYDVTPGTHYFYFVKAATSSSGADESTYSDSDEGWAYAPSPSIDPPTVYTDYAFGIEQTEAYIKCGISNTGGESANMRGVEYRDVTAGGSTQSTGSSGSFDVGEWGSHLSNLTSGHQYQARAYATNSEGTGYGQWITFNTLP